MFCPKCGNNLNGNEDFCCKCGFNIKALRKKKKNNKKVFIIALLIVVAIILSLMGYKLYSKNISNNNDIDEDMFITQKLLLDYEDGKITTDEYVRYSLYAAFNSNLLKDSYSGYKKSDAYTHADKLVEQYYDELTDETLRYYLSQINLDYVTFELDKENDETNNKLSVSDLLIDQVSAKADKVTNLNKVVLSSGGNFVVWYTTTGSSATNYTYANKVAEGLEASIEKYTELFGKKYKFNSDVFSKGKTYSNQKKILEKNNISEEYLTSAMQIYLVEADADALAFYVGKQGVLRDLFNKFRGGDQYGAVANPYIVIKPSSFSDSERLEQLYNHEFFHHYQSNILCNQESCNISDPYISEASANWASSLISKKTTIKGFLNEWASTARKFSSNLLSKEILKKYGVLKMSYALYIYLNNYSLVVDNGDDYIIESIYQKDSLKYLNDKASRKNLYDIQKIIALKNLSQDYENKNLIVDPDYSDIFINIKDTISGEASYQNRDLSKIGIDYYLLDIDSSSAFEIDVEGNNRNINTFIIAKKGENYEVVGYSSVDTNKDKFDTNKYGEYDKLYIAVSNTSLVEENRYSLSVKKINKNNSSIDNDSKEEDNTFSTTFSNYNIEMEMNITVSGINTNTVSKGVVDELHQKEYLDVTTTSMSFVSLNNKVYHDFNKGYTYMTQPYGGDVWWKEKSTAQLIDLGIILNKLISMENVNKISDNHYKVKMTQDEINGLMASGNASSATISGDVYVDVYTDSGYIVKLEYDFTKLVQGFDLFTATINFSNYNNAGDVEIPQDIIDGAKIK